jgi:CRISPR/Cas system-associated exonuclease Cas4 (RecB family)
MKHILFILLLGFVATQTARAQVEPTKSRNVRTEAVVYTVPVVVHVTHNGEPIGTGDFASRAIKLGR